MGKLKQISIGFSYKQGLCNVCGKDKLVVEVGTDNKLSICDVCAIEVNDIHNNMKLMKTGG